MNIAGTRKALNLLISTLDTTKSTISPIEFPERKKRFEPVEASFFEGVTPESRGVSSNDVAEFVKELAHNRSVGLHSIMLMRGDKVLFDADIGKQDSRLPKATFSECKSIIALAIGVLVTQGRLRLSEKIVDIFADKAPSVAKIRLKSLTVKHLLTMTAGVTFNESEAMVSADWVKSFLGSDVEGEFGKVFRYNSLNSYMLAAIIVERTGMSVSEFLDSTIFGELEITDYYWEKCPSGIEKGGWGLYIRREDLAKLGLLVLQNGMWNGRKLIASKYIDNATKAQAEVPEEYGNFSYGYHIWCGREKNSFLFNGMLGQNLLCYRDSGISIIANCGNCDMFQQNEFFEICDRYFGKEFSDILPENESGYTALCGLREELKKTPERRSFLATSTASRDIEKDIYALDGAVFGTDCSNSVSTGFAPLLMQLIQGNYTGGLTEIAFRKGKTGLEVDFIEGGEVHTIEVGFGKAVTGVVSFCGEEFAVSAEGFFRENEDGIPVLKIECDFIETPYQRSYKFFFEDGNYRAAFCERPAIDVAENPATLMALLGASGQKLESIFSRLDGDYINIKLEKAFSPRLILVKKE